MNIPNKITIFRILLAFLFVFLLFCRGVFAKSLAMFVFALAAFSDYLDGKFARDLNQLSTFGKLMDPIADKILILAAFLAFVEMKLVPAWMVMIIIFRELVITGLRLIAVTRRKILSAGWQGKHKVVIQIFTIFAVLAFLIVKESLTDFWNPVLERWYLRIIFYLMALTVAVTLYSGTYYLWRNRDIFGENNAKDN
jgi:CDP-diacylglycerol--glycerol-3-phosphate 3-phosphatidyltransferase